MERLVIAQAVLVEGRYDKTTLEALLDGVILPVHGFSVFTDRPLQQLIRQLARDQGIVVLMDSDAAGFKIRGFVGGLVPPDQLVHVYIPDVEGKERRKKVGSKEGTLGVEGMDLATLKEAFAKAGLVGQSAPEEREKITKAHLFAAGLTGGTGSSQQRQRLYYRLGLPRKMSTNGALPILNQMLSIEEFWALTQELGE